MTPSFWDLMSWLGGALLILLISVIGGFAYVWPFFRDVTMIVLLYIIANTLKERS